MLPTPLRRLWQKTTLGFVAIVAAAPAVAALAPAEEEWADEFLAVEDLERDGEPAAHVKVGLSLAVALGTHSKSWDVPRRVCSHTVLLVLRLAFDV